MRFAGISLVEQTEQKLRRFESVLKKNKPGKTSPSRRHIQGSKIAKGLYSLLRYPREEKLEKTSELFSKFFFDFFCLR